MFRLPPGAGQEVRSLERADRLCVRATIRSLEGMQKEALVSVNGATAWRMVSDEGPYLNGTDLAPFPLAFYSAGMQLCLISELLRAASKHGFATPALTLHQHNRYRMEGSFLRGDATGGPMPAELSIELQGDGTSDALETIIHNALDASPGETLMCDALSNRFGLTLNGEALSLSDSDVRSIEAPRDDPARSFEDASPGEDSVASDLVVKTKAAKTQHGVEGGAGSSLRSEQKRTLHVEATAMPAGGHVAESAVDLRKPIGSSFRFRSDEPAANGGADSAPPPIAYLAAGVGFCFMTQLGRYAHIINEHPTSYRIVQDMTFATTGSEEGDTPHCMAEPVATHLLIDGDHSPDLARDLLTVSERTCFLHAAMRGVYPSRVSAQFNDTALEIGS